MCEAVKVANRLIRRFGTHDPFRICQDLNIRIGYADLAAVRGIFLRNYRRKQIYINSELQDSIKRQVCAHELGHAVLHGKINTYFLDHCTFSITNKIEVEANIFAAQLLITEPGDTLEQIAMANGLELAVVSCWEKTRFGQTKNKPLE